MRRLPRRQESERWVHLTAEGTRFFHLGEELEPGTLLGLSPFGGRMEVVDIPSRVVRVLFDIWEDRITLVLRPTA